MPGTNHRPGAAGAWRRGAALPRDGICGACLTPVREGTVDHRDTVQSEAEKTGRRTAYCAVLLHQPVGQFSYRSRGISGPSPAGRRGRPVSPVRRAKRRQSPSRSTAADTAAGEDAAGAVQSNTARRCGPGADGQLNRGDQQTARAFCFIRHGSGKPGGPGHRHQAEGKSHRATSSRPARSDGPNVTISSARTLIVNGTSARVRRRLRFSR